MFIHLAFAALFQIFFLLCSCSSLCAAMPRLLKKGVPSKITERNERVRRQKEQAFVQSLVESQSFLSLMEKFPSGEGSSG
jgi:hypothetical protein